MQCVKETGDCIRGVTLEDSKYPKTALALLTVMDNERMKTSSWKKQTDTVKQNRQKQNSILHTQASQCVQPLIRYFVKNGGKHFFLLKKDKLRTNPPRSSFLNLAVKRRELQVYSKKRKTRQLT